MPERASYLQTRWIASQIGSSLLQQLALSIRTPTHERFPERLEIKIDGELKNSYAHLIFSQQFLQLAVSAFSSPKLGFHRQPLIHH